MAHLPINHPMRPLWRALAGLAGLYVLIFGIVGVSRSWGHPFFGTSDVRALGLHTNPAFSILSIVVGVVVLCAVVYGRNADHYLNMLAGFIFLLTGMLMLALLRTTANFLNFSMGTCIVSYLIGIVLLTAGLYGRVGTPEEVEAQEHHRHNREPATSAH